jgi:hypothetical protein
VSPDNLPTPKKASGFLRDFIIRSGGDRSQCVSDEEEAARRVQIKEAARKRQKKSITLTVGTVEAIDSEVARLEGLGLHGLASRDKIVDAAMATLVERAIGASIRPR